MYLYRCESRITVKFDNLGNPWESAHTFAIYTDPVGNARVEDYRALYPLPRSVRAHENQLLDSYFGTSKQELFSLQQDRYDQEQWDQLWLKYFLMEKEYLLKTDVVLGLWNSQELIDKLQSMRTNRQFTLVKVKHYRANDNKLRLNLTSMSDEEVRILNDFFNVTMTHEIQCTKITLHTQQTSFSQGGGGGSALKRQREES
jgi:hypothetical protein